MSIREIHHHPPIDTESFILLWFCADVNLHVLCGGVLDDYFTLLDLIGDEEILVLDMLGSFTT